jgi:dihydroorotate dehydrogenase electron transfer subunit
VVQETSRVKSFRLRAPAIARTATPGQFVMVWIPGVDEIPMSISAADPTAGFVEFAVTRVGDATSQLHSAKAGTLLGLRGPLGHGFRLPPVKPPGRLLIVGGGCGAAPLLFAAQYTLRAGWKVDVVIGARTKTELLYRRQLGRLGATVFTTTEDGSDGLTGTAVDGARERLEGMSATSRYAACFACGPERMLVSLQRLAAHYGVPLQVSLERYMKCGVGLCGHCVIDGAGTRVCLEGPVFEAGQLRKTDFGKTDRDATGQRHPLAP